jgi:hypothetical protein
MLVERYSTESGERYVVSKVYSEDQSEEDAFLASGFVVGVEPTHWNGIPIARAVDLYAERETGGRPDARRARALESLTIRPLRYTLPPSEEWVIVSFIGGNKAAGEVRLKWRLRELPDTPPSVSLDGPAQFAYAINPAAEAARRVKKLLFAKDNQQKSGRGASPTPSNASRASKDGWITGKFQDVVAARQVEILAGSFGHLRLWSFNVSDDDDFISEVIRLLDELPKNGLVIDLRANPGGLVWAAERLLQLFTPNEVSPARFSMMATELTRTMAAANQNQQLFGQWRRSLESAVASGELYSRSVPLTPPTRCNDIGQRYPGPVLAVVDANTYSAGDLFAAGFVDNRIGTLVSVDEATEAGGANVWYPQHVHRALAGTTAAIAQLPKGIGYTISFRRATRIGDAAGTGIEDVGILGHVRRPLTKNDLTNSNENLLAFCGRLLVSEEFTDLAVAASANSVQIATTNLDRVDVFADGFPSESHLISNRRGNSTLVHQLTSPWSEIEIIGYVGAIRRQRRIVRPEGV